MEKTEAQFKDVYEYIEKSNLMFRFLEWKKSSVESNGKAIVWARQNHQSWQN